MFSDAVCSHCAATSNLEFRGFNGSETTFLLCSAMRGVYTCGDGPLLQWISDGNVLATVIGHGEKKKENLTPHHLFIGVP